MALITTAAREELIALFTAMFKAAPGANNLNSIVASYEAGATTAQIAASLAARSEFQSIYPNLQTAEEFAASLIATMLPASTPADAVNWATGWITGELASGRSRASIITEAVQALRATTNPKFADAQTLLANKVEVATYYSVTQLQSSTSLATLQNVIAGVTTDPDTIQDAKDAVDGIVADNLGQKYNLTASVDTITAGAGNDEFNGQIDVGTSVTITGLDNLNGGAGKDTINIFDVDGNNPFPNVTLTDIETLNFISSQDADNNGGTIDFTTSKISGLENINIDAGGTVKAKAGDAHVVTVNNSTGTVTLDGGASQTVTTAGGFVLSGSKGAVTVTDTAQAAVASSVQGGTDIDVTTTSTGTGTVSIGTTTPPTGTIKLVQNVNGNGAALTGGAVSVKGGTSADITLNALNKNGFTTTLGTVGVDADGTATTVSVTQTPVATAAATVAAVAAVKQVETVTFTALAAGATATVNGLTFKAGAAGTTAAETAAAFANLTNGDTQGASALGVYTGAYAADASSGGVSTATVTFTADKAGTAAGITTAGGANASVVTIANVASVKAAGAPGVVDGAVTITDGGTTDVLSTVSISGYGAGAAVTSDALTSLSLANSGAAGTATVTNAKATTLALGLNNVKAGVNIGATYTAVNATTSGANSTFTLTAGGVTSLSVAGDKTLDISGAALGALKTVTVTGSAGLTLAAAEAATLTSVDSSGTTGTTKVSIDGTKATYTGGAGVDTVTLTTDAPTKAISLGGGNDTVIFFSGTTSVTGASITGGEGTDTATLLAADAVVLDGSADFANKVTGFEVLGLTGATGAQTIDVGILGFSKVSSSASAGTLTLDKVASGGTLTITGATAGTGYIVNVTDAATGKADVLNLGVTGATIAAGTVTAANVETVNITSSATTAAAADSTLTLVATSATAITVTGNQDLTLTNTGNTKVASIDASTMTGALTVTAAGTTATTITGGSGNDLLTASTGTKADVLIGGAGNDTLTGNGGLSTLTGGAGDDLFIAVASANVNSYVTITDGSAGDRIQLVAQGAETFQAAAISLGDTAVFQDYANAAINAGGDASTNGYIAWFQFGGNTYIVESLHNATTPGLEDFQNGTDVIVRLTGLVDLSTASFNNDTNALLQIN